MPDIFDSISPSSSTQNPPDYTNQYNTPLNSQEQSKFKQWKAKYAPNDTGSDYDLQGAFKAGITPDKDRGHFPDTFKKPNHPTFSDESQYSGKNGMIGGHWGDDGTYSPSNTNLQMRTQQQLQDYFTKNEPDTKLKGTDIFDQISPTQSNADIMKTGKDQYSNANIIKRAPDALPAVGGMIAGVPGAAAGSFAKQALSQNPSLQDAGTDTLLQGVLPEAVGGIAGVLRDVKSQGLLKTIADRLPTSIASKLPGTKAAQIINQARGLMGPEGAMVETAGQNARANLSPKTYDPNTVAGDLVGTPYTHDEVANTPPIGKTADKIFSDVSEVQNAKLSTGDPTIIRQLARDRIMRKNWNFDNGNFNPDNVLNDLGKNEDVYREAMGPDYDNMKALMQQAQKLKVGQTQDSLISWHEVRKVGALEVGGELLGIPRGVTSVLTFGTDAMRKIAADPALGQLVIAAMKAPKNSPATSLFGAALKAGLRGTTLYMTNDDGKKEPVTIGQDGALQYPKP